MPTCWARCSPDRLNYITVVEPAEVPSVPVSPKVALNLALAIAVGLTLSVGAVLLLEYLDDTIRSPAEVRTSAERAYPDRNWPAGWQRLSHPTYC